MFLFRSAWDDVAVIHPSYLSPHTEPCRVVPSGSMVPRPSNTLHSKQNSMFSVLVLTQLPP